MLEEFWRRSTKLLTRRENVSKEMKLAFLQLLSLEWRRLKKHVIQLHSMALRT